MIDFIYSVIFYLASIFFSGNKWQIAFVFFPFIFLLELPFTLLVTAFCVRGWLYIHFQKAEGEGYKPLVTIIVTAYSESLEEIKITLETINEQIYAGTIETLFIVDNARANAKTSINAQQVIRQLSKTSNRIYKVIDKSSRGGHANSMNLGLRLARGEVIFMLDADTSIDNQTVARAVKHFKNRDVIAVSGAVRVRNIYDTIATRFQALEYMVSIQLGRFGLTELKMTNNLSGCFGIFRKDFLRRIGGWLNGTAEDLDLTIRMHAYIGKNPHLKIIHEPLAIAWTAAPVTFRQLMKQRLRWDGDLYYIYVRRHWRNFSSRIINPIKTFFLILYALYYQLMLPFIIIVYFALILVQYDLPFVVGMLILVYLFYTVLSLFSFLLFLLLVSERVAQDAKLIGWVFLYPVYNMFMRYMALFFILNEVIFKGHKDTSMAPYWVIKKTK